MLLLAFTASNLTHDNFNTTLARIISSRIRRKTGRECVSVQRSNRAGLEENHDQQHKICATPMIKAAVVKHVPYVQV